MNKPKEYLTPYEESLLALIEVKEDVNLTNKKIHDHLRFEIQDKLSSRDNYRDMVRMNLQVIDGLRKELEGKK